jgi:hypothetical protein
MVAHYALNEAGGDIAYDSGEGNHGALVGPPTWERGGLQFGGIASGEYVNLGSPASLDIDWQNLTAAVLLKLDSVAADYRIIDANWAANGSWTLWLDNGQPRFSMRNTGGTIVTVAQGTSISLTEPTHLAATFDGAIMRLYVNGNLVDSDTHSGTFNNAVPIEISSAVAAEFLGRIDQVSIHNSTLVASESQQLAMNPNIVYEPRLLPISVAAPAEEFIPQVIMI